MSQKESSKKEVTLKGIPASPGIITGKVHLYFRNETPVNARSLEPNEVPNEVDRFLSAIEKAKEEINALRQEYVKNTGAFQEGMIFEAHAMILEDPLIVEKTISGIEKTKMNAEYCFNLAVNGVIDMFSTMKKDFFRERVVDIIDIKRRILRNLSDNDASDLRNLKESVVVVAPDLGPSDTASMDRSHVQAILTDVGGYTSHSVIIARSMGIPAVVALSDISGRVEAGDTVVVDGYTGNVILHPSVETEEKYQQRREEYTAMGESLKGLKDAPAITLDGFKIELAANIETKSELGDVVKYGATGVGLLRTEFLCLQLNEFPSEQEQFGLYSTIFEAVTPDPVIVRTYDLGGDKFNMLQNTGNEQNPFLGWRAIRFCLDHPQIFKSQLRAILRAGVKGNVKIMFPFISDVSEVIQSREILNEVHHELENQDIPFAKEYEVGVMIETPSAAICADILAPVVDFFSIGSNDLTQYILAVDRGNEKIVDRYDPLNPAVLRAMNRTIICGHKAGIWVGICGEVAADPLVAYLLIGLGVDELSISPIFIPDVKQLIRSIHFDRARVTAQKALKMDTSAKIRDLLRNDLKDIL